MKKEILSELSDLDKEIDFIKAFIDYWKIIKVNISSKGKFIDWQKWNEIAKNLLNSVTIPFYDNWKNSGMLSYIAAYINEFSSIALKLKGDLILIPKQLIFFESCNPDNTLLSSLKRNPTKVNLERVLLLLFKDLNVRLRKTDFEIIQKLAQPRFSKSLDKFPKNKELAYSIRCDIRTVSRSYSYLYQHQILSLIFLVDMARIGYQTIFIFHTKDMIKIPNSIKQYIVLNFPTPFEDKSLTVLQYPYRDTPAYTNLMTYFDSKDRVIIKNQYRGWNLAGLTKKPIVRWKIRPPLLEDGEMWSKELIINDLGVELNLDPFFDQYNLSYREGQLLGLVHKHSTMAEEYLSKQLNVSRSYILEDWKNFLRNRIIFRFPIFRNIGLGSWIYFYIRGLISHKDTKNVINHLKFFPYVNVLYNIESGTLVCRMNLSPSWTSDFIYQLASLPDIYPGCSYFYYVGPKAYCPWGFDILGTFDWNNLPEK